MNRPRRVRKSSALTILLVCAFGMVGCATPPFPQPDSVSAVGDDSVLVVGRIELLPPLEEDEQSFPPDPFGLSQLYLNRALFFLSREPVLPDRTQLGFGPYINPVLGETFFFSIPKAMPYAAEGKVYLSYESEIPIPPFQIDIEGSARAMYIGTLRIERDEFNGIVSAQVVDDYEQGLRAFRERFDSSVKLHKRLAQPLTM